MLYYLTTTPPSKQTDTCENITFPQPLLRVETNDVYKFILRNGLLTLPDIYSDSKPYGYIVLFGAIHIGSDLDLDLYSDGFPNGYCTHFRDRSLPLLHTFQSEDQSLNLNQCEISAYYRNLSPSRDLSPDPPMWISHNTNTFMVKFVELMEVGTKCNHSVTSD